MVDRRRNLRAGQRAQVDPVDLVALVVRVHAARVVEHARLAKGWRRERTRRDRLHRRW